MITLLELLLLFFSDRIHIALFIHVWIQNRLLVIFLNSPLHFIPLADVVLNFGLPVTNSIEEIMSSCTLVLLLLELPCILILVLLHCSLLTEIVLHALPLLSDFVHFLLSEPFSILNILLNLGSSIS